MAILAGRGKGRDFHSLWQGIGKGGDDGTRSRYAAVGKLRANRCLKGSNRVGVKVKEKVKGSGEWWIFINHRGKRKAKKIGNEKTAFEVARKI